MRSRRQQGHKPDETVTVTGPGCEGREAPNDGAGMSLALYLASQLKADCTFYVRRDGATVATVERTGRTVVTRRTAAAS